MNAEAFKILLEKGAQIDGHVLFDGLCQTQEFEEFHAQIMQHLFKTYENLYGLHDHSTLGKVNVIWCAVGSADRLEFVLKHSCEGINQKCNSDGSTALHVASHYGQVEDVKLLLKYGADQNLLNDRRMTALQEAVVGHYAPSLIFSKKEGFLLKKFKNAKQVLITLLRVKNKGGILDKAINFLLQIGGKSTEKAFNHVTQLLNRGKDLCESSKDFNGALAHYQVANLLYYLFIETCRHPNVGINEAASQMP